MLAERVKLGIEVGRGVRV